MHRIVLGMAAVNYMLVAGTAYLGLASAEPADPQRIGQDLFGYHFRLGIFTSLFTILVHCVVFTYFLGTNRWVRETAAAYALEQGFIQTSSLHRSRAFAAVLLSILLVVGTVATGAGAHTGVWPLWLHQVIPVLTYGFMIFAYHVEYSAIERHVALTDEVMTAVGEIRCRCGPPAEQ